MDSQDVEKFNEIWIIGALNFTGPCFIVRDSSIGCLSFRNNILRRSLIIRSLLQPLLLFRLLLLPLWLVRSLFQPLLLMWVLLLPLWLPHVDMDVNFWRVRARGGGRRR